MGRLRAVDAWAAGVGMKVIAGAVAALLLAASPQRVLDAHCGESFFRCPAPSGASAEKLVHAQRDRADRVVLGKVVRIDTLAAYMVEHGPTQIPTRALSAHVAVSRVWKGAPVDTMTVMFGTIGLVSSCDLALQAGTSYVIFASRYDDGVLHTRQCTGTAREGDATTTIAALGAGEVPER